LHLFNETGTGTASTNHLAAAAGISVGNLYYHFKNKEEVIRALFERYSGDTDRTFSLSPDHAPTLEDLERMISENFVVLWKYRFFYRERIALIQRDPVLAERYYTVRERGFVGFRHLVHAFTEAGLLRAPQSETELNQLAQVCWIVSDFYLPFIEAESATTSLPELASRHQEEGTALLRFVLKPYRIDNK